MLHYFGFRAANHVASFAGDLQVSALMKTWSRFLQLAQLQWAQFQPPGGLVKTICEVGGPPRTSQYRTGRKERFMCLCSPNNRGLIANYWSSNAVTHGKPSTGCMIGHFLHRQSKRQAAFVRKTQPSVGLHTLQTVERLVCHFTNDHDRTRWRRKRHATQTACVRTP